MRIFNYRWRPEIVRELDSDTSIDLTNEWMLKQKDYRIFNITEQSIRIIINGGIFIGIEYLCKDNDKTIDENNNCDFVLPALSSKLFILNRWGTCLQVKD